MPKVMKDNKPKIQEILRKFAIKLHFGHIIVKLLSNKDGLD